MAWSNEIQIYTDKTKVLYSILNANNIKLFENTKYLKQELEIFAEDYRLEQIAQDTKISTLEVSSGRHDTDIANLKSTKLNSATFTSYRDEQATKDAQQDAKAVEQDTRIEKVNARLGLDGNNETNFDFIRSKVVQDGLVAINDDSIEQHTMWMWVVKPKGIQLNVGTFVSSDNGMTYYIQTMSGYCQIYSTSLPYNLVVRYTRGFEYGKDYLIISFNNGSLTVSTSRGDTGTATRADLFKSRPRGKTDAKANYFAFIYNRALIPEEIQHNIQVLNNSPSISEITTTNEQGEKTTYKLDTDSEHVVHRNGYNAEECLTGIYDMCKKEFSSSNPEHVDANGNIVIPNAIDKSKILSASITGNTFKNYYDERETTRVSLLDNGYMNLIFSGFYDNPTPNGLLKLEPDTKYVVVADILENTTNGNISVADASDRTVWFSGGISIPAGATGILKGLLTTKSDISTGWDFNFRHANNLTGVIKLRISLYKDADINKYNAYTPFGLSSTQAIIDCNGLKYPFYEPTIQGKTRILKTLKGTQNWVEIDASEVRDTATYDYKLESIGGDLGSVPSASDYVDRAGKVKMMNTKEIILEGKDNWLLTNNADGYYRYQLALDMTTSINNILADKVAVKPNGDVRSVFGFFRVGNTNYVYVDTTLSTPTLLNNYFTTNPTKVRYQSTTPQTIQLTDEQMKAYDVFKKLILLGGVGDIRDTLEIKEDGSGVYTQNTKEIVLNGSESWVSAGSTSLDTLMFEYSNSTFKRDKLGIVSDRFYTNSNGSDELWNANIEACCLATPISALRIRILKSKLQTLNTTGFKEWLQSNPVTMRYQLATPVVTEIPKEICPTIPLNKINILSVDSAVSPSSFKAMVPVDRVAEQQSEIDSIKKQLGALATLQLDQIK